MWEKGSETIVQARVELVSTIDSDNQGRETDDSFITVSTIYWMATLPALCQKYSMGHIITEETSSSGGCSRAKLLGFISSCSSYCMAFGKFLNFFYKMKIILPTSQGCYKAPCLAHN